MGQLDLLLDILMKYGPKLCFTNKDRNLLLKEASQTISYMEKVLKNKCPNCISNMLTIMQR